MGVEKTYKKIAEYISVTQPIVDDYNTFKEGVIKEAHETVGALEAVGLISMDKKAEFTQMLIDDPLQSFSVLRKVAANIQEKEEYVSNDLSIGKSANIKKESNEKLDAFDRWVLFDDPRATGIKTNHVLV